LLDAGEAFHLVNSQLSVNISRLSALVHMLGGEYPVAHEDLPEAPSDLVGRVFYDLDWTQIAVNELGEHISQLERLCGVPVVGELQAPAPVLVPQPYDPDEEAPSA
jgi:hypothetical protein